MNQPERKLKRILKKASPDVLSSVLEDLNLPKTAHNKESTAFSPVIRESLATAASLVLFLSVTVGAMIIIGSGSHLGSSQGTTPEQSEQHLATQPPSDPEQTEFPEVTWPYVKQENTVDDAIFIACNYHNIPTLRGDYSREIIETKVSCRDLGIDSDEITTVYTVHLQCDGYQYSLDIIAANGALRNSSVTRLDPSIPLHWKTLRDIALNDADVEITKLTEFSIKIMTEPNTLRIRFRAAPLQYEYKLNSQTGEILESLRTDSSFGTDELLSKDHVMRQNAIAVAIQNCWEKYPYCSYDNLIEFTSQPEYADGQLSSYVITLETTNHPKLVIDIQVLNETGFRVTGITAQP